MAHSLPVVATRVGSIPDFIEGAAELVEPKNPTELAMAIRHLIHESNLRRDYIEQGQKLARQNTLDARSKEMIVAIEGYLNA